MPPGFPPEVLMHIGTLWLFTAPASQCAQVVIMVLKLQWRTTCLGLSESNRPPICINIFVVKVEGLCTDSISVAIWAKSMLVYRYKQQ